MTKAKRHSNGEGSVSKYRNGYRAAFSTPGGNRVFKNFSTEADAQAWIVDQRAAVIHSIYVEPSKITLIQWIVMYLTRCAKDGEIRASTLLRYKQTAAHLKPLANVPMQKITHLLVKDYFSNLDASVSDNTRLKIYKLLNLLFKNAVLDNLLQYNIMDRVPAPKCPPPKVEPFSLEEINQLLTTVADNKYYSKYLPFFLLAVMTGARMGELLALKITDIHDNYIMIEHTLEQFKASQVKEADTKTEQGRRKVTVDPELIAMLKAVYMVEPVVVGGYIFHTSTGKPYTIRNMERTWTKVLEAAQIPHKHFHALRHFHATGLLGEGVPLLEVSHRLGHSKPSTTLNFYGDAIKGYQDKIPGIVTNMLNKKMGTE